MCGILGTTTQSPSQEGVKTLLHRGPDYQSTYTDKNITLHHVLLAIRGAVTDSGQPVTEDTSPWVLVFNGQLYNTATLRSLLGTNTPHTDVDTLLLYALIKKVGWHFIEHIQGMFAIALYNKQEGVVRLYRDQSGQKNLYYTIRPTGLSFASEIKALQSIHSDLHTIDREALVLSEFVGYIPGHRTLVAHISKLEPSEELTYTIARRSLTKRMFVVKGAAEFEGLSPEEALTRTVQDHLQSNRDIAINLSGGLDSSLLFHEAVRDGRSVHAFSTRFEVSESTYNTDADLAERLANEYTQEFTPIIITKESYRSHFEKAYSCIEEPNFNISLPTYYQTARTEGIQGAGLRVVLSGDGGDELFGGYPHYETTRRYHTLRSFLGTPLFNALKRYRTGESIDYENVVAVFLKERKIQRWKNAEVRKQVENTLQSYVAPYLTQYGHKKHPVYDAMLLDRYVWLAEENFIRSDKLYMSQSMEMRCPLAYTPLRSYMDTHIKNNDYISPKENKLFLRRMYDGKLPGYITKRPDKTGWRAPVQVWYDASYKKMFLDILSSVPHTQDVIDWKMLEKRVEEKETWPGKSIHLYLSLALLIKTYNLKQ